MSLLRNIRAPLRQLPSNVAGQTVVTYAVIVCLFAAVLVLATTLWKDGEIPPDPPQAEDSS